MDLTKINVRLDGLSDIMFDRFIDHSKELRPPEQKLYLVRNNELILPSENIISFLFSENPPGCAKGFEGKPGKQYIQLGQGHVFIDPVAISFMDDTGKKIVFDGFNKKFYIHEGAPRTKQGTLSIKQEIKKRPVLSLPWFLNFQVTIVKNELIDETKLYNWFIRGGIQIALGTYRPRYGRFDVGKWDIQG